MAVGKRYKRKKITTFFSLILLLVATFALAAFSNVFSSKRLGAHSLSTNTLLVKNNPLARAMSRIVELPEKPKQFPNLAQYIKVNKKNTAPGLILLPLSGPEQVWLFDTAGRMLNMWMVDASKAELLPNGHLLVIHGSKFLENQYPWSLLRKVIAEYDWDGNLVWSYTDKPEHIHHDGFVRENGNVVFIAKRSLGEDIRAKITNPVRKTIDVRADIIVEVNRAGKVVWRWNSWDYLDINYCGPYTCKERVAAYKHSLLNGAKRISGNLRGWLHTNTVSEIPPNKWYDKGDKRFKPGNLIIMPRNLWTMYIIDKESKQIVWEYKGDYKGGLGAAHAPYMIPKGLPGEGNILILDNSSFRRHNGESYVLEINPVTKKVVWVYDVGKKFFCRTRGWVKRMPNGNTFISNDMKNVLFEVTPEKEIVWKFASPKPISRGIKYPPSYCKKCFLLAEAH